MSRNRKAKIEKLLSTCEKENSPGDDPITDVMANFKVRGEQILRFRIDLGLGIIGNRWGVEKVEKAVVFHLFGDCPHVAFALVLLLLFDRFDGQVFALFPGDGAAFAFEDFRALEAEGIVFTGFTLHLVLLGQHGVGKVVVGSKVKVQSKSLKKMLNVSNFMIFCVKK